MFWTAGGMYLESRMRIMGILLGGSGESPEMQKRLDKLLHEIRSRRCLECSSQQSMQKLRRDFSRYEGSVRTEKQGKEERFRNLEEHSCRIRAVSAGSMTVQEGARTAAKDASQAERPAWGESGGAASHSPGVLRMRGSVARAAEQLNLHKNYTTVPHETAVPDVEMEQDSAFVREFFIRMLLEYRNMPESG